jgi:hypothetical protein
MARLGLTAALAGALALGGTAAAWATAVNVTDNSWWTFDVDDSVVPLFGTTWIDAQSNSPRGYKNDGSLLSFTFTLTAPTYMRVVDGGQSGDVFTVFDNDNSLGQTSSTSNSSQNASNFDAAFANPAFSKATYLLAPGDHTITGSLFSTTQSFNATIGAIQLQPVPLPAATWLLGSGLAALLGFVRRKAA